MSFSHKNTILRCFHFLTTNDISSSFKCLKFPSETFTQLWFLQSGVPYDSQLTLLKTYKDFFFLGFPIEMCRKYPSMDRIAMNVTGHINGAVKDVTDRVWEYSGRTYKPGSH